MQINMKPSRLLALSSLCLALSLGVAGTAAAQDSVRNGGYTMWCYEHLSYKGTPTGDELALINKVKTNIAANLGVNGIDINSMIATRSGDGEVVGP